MSENHAQLTVAKALLLCAHAEELSRQCLVVLRHGSMDTLLECQARKQTIIEQLAMLLTDQTVAFVPEVTSAVTQLRAALHKETTMASYTAEELKSELLSVGAAQRRLTLARQYDTAADATPAHTGGLLSVRG